MIKEEIEPDKTNIFKISSSKAFKYLRYVAPKSKNESVSSFEIYGTYESNEELLKEDMFQPTNLPLLVINSENGEMPQGRDKETKVKANFLLINEGKVNMKKTGTIKLRGNSSLNSEKKPYLINLEEKTIVLDMPAKAKKWTLVPNMYDKTLMRNILGYKMSFIFGLKYTPSCRFIDIILNGDFVGNYMICDKIEVSKDRVDIAKMDETCIEEPEISGGYLLQGRGNGRNRDILSFKTNKGITLSYEYPKLEDITEEQKIYIKNKIDEIEAKVYENITENIDLESFARYFLVEDFSANQDEIFNSFFLYKERRDDKIYFGPVWDFDLAFDNAMILYPSNEKKNFAYKFTLSNGPANKFLSNLLSNDKVLKKVKDTWRLMTNTVFTKEVMRDYINELYELIYESQKLNYIRWDALNSKQFMEAVIRGSFEAEVDYLKEYVEKRFKVFGEIVANATSASVLEEVSRPGPWGWGNRDRRKKNETNLHEGSKNNNDNN
jgi:spore coat protein CotH